MPSDSSKSGTLIIMQQQQIQQQQNMTMTSYTQDDIQTIKAVSSSLSFFKPMDIVYKSNYFKITEKSKEGV